MRVSDEIISSLMNLGFSSYQAKTYAGLILLGGLASAPEISKESGVPKARIYDVLEEMSNEPLQAVAKLPSDETGKTIYVATPPEKLINRLLDEKKSIGKKIIETLSELSRIPPIENLLVTLKNKPLTSNDIKSALIIFTHGIDETRLINELKELDTISIPILTNKLIPPGIAIVIKKRSTSIISLNPLASSEVLTFHSERLKTLIDQILYNTRPSLIKNNFLRSREVIYWGYGLSLLGKGKFSAHSLNESFLIGVTKSSFEIYVQDLVDLSIPLSNIQNITLNEEFLELHVVDRKGMYLGSLTIKALNPGELKYIIEVLTF